MNINLLGITTSLGGRALFINCWKVERWWLLLSVVEIHVKYVLLIGIAALAGIGLLIFTPPSGDAVLMSRYISNSGLNYAVIYQEVAKWAAVAYGVAILATLLVIMRRYYQADALGYSSFRQFEIDRRPELRLQILKLQQYRQAKAEQRGVTHE